MGKDRKQTALAKFKKGMIEWKDVPEELKHQADRYNSDGGEYRAEKVKRKDDLSKKDMEEQIKEKEEDDN